MIRTALLIAAGLGMAGSSLAQGDRKIEYLNKEPPAGSVPYRKVVHVDDGTCPQGQVKEITGGSQERSIPRKVRCVERRN
jgi:hypothetical protein